MIAIGNVAVSDEVVEENFVCNLSKCKGGCCVEGDCGAPLTEDETVILSKIYPEIKPYLTLEYIPEIERQGTHTTDKEHDYVTPTVGNGICVYGVIEENGVVKCGIENAWKAGATHFQKPISCHLYPIRIKENSGYEMVNYDPREDLCKAACKLGDQLKVPVYKFLQAALVRKYGQEFFDILDAYAKQYSVKD